MQMLSKHVWILVAVLTLTVVVTWQATGGDWYTKYQVVEQVTAKADPDDPLVAAGFYDDGATTKTVTRDEFRLGLLPTPSGVFDKHAVSVASIAGPLWLLGLGVFWYDRRRSRRGRVVKT
ncbi:hypothetical protein GF377_02530 [candidate division GN15 bacterium]|nr:hypothetical protein [candidate division GN15 bacterium]